MVPSMQLSEAEPPPIHVLVVEDDPEFHRRFCDAVAGDDALRLLDAAYTGAQALDMLARHRPDVMLVDLGLPDMSGLQVMVQARARHPGMDMLVVTIFGDDHHVLRSIERGATGYLLKDASHEDIRRGIRQLHAGGSPISPSIARRVLGRFRVAEAPAPARAAPPPVRRPLGPDQEALSEREVEILRLISRGMSVRDTGLALGISQHTVATHLKNVYQKLAVHSRSEAVYEAVQMGWL